MLSIALFPCSYTDGARLVGELSNALNGRLYTDALLVEDVARRFDIPMKDIHWWLYGAALPENRWTLEKDKYVNLFKQILVHQLSQATPKMFYGYLASLIGPEIKHVLKILVVDSRESRIKRAEGQERCSRRKAEEIITNHDRKVSLWTQFLFATEAYDYSLYDCIISYDSRNMLEVKEEIIECYRLHDSIVPDTVIEKRAKDMEIATAVERVLLERGYKAGVQICEGLVELKVEVSDYNYPWLAHKLTELSRSVQGVHDVRVERAS